MKAITPTSGPGNKGRARPARARGFTLLELLVVLALFAMVVSTVSLAIRDPSTTQLEREAERLSALLESGRAQARAQGLAVRWQTARLEGNTTGDDFRFVGLPDAAQLPTRWLNAEVRAEVIGAPFLSLGPDPIIGAQRVMLMLGDRRITLATDGLQPFAIAVDEVPQ